MAKILLIIAPENFRDEELFVTREELEQAGHETLVTSTKKGQIKGVRGGSQEVETLVSDININDFDAVVFVGGGGMRVLFDEADILNIAKEMYDSKKVVAAICIAPVILANAGLLNGKRATSFESEIETMESKGVEFIYSDVVVDGKIVTANGPHSSSSFASEINKLL